MPILILGNKIDRPEAISEDALRGMFGLYGHTTGKVGHWGNIFNTCTVYLKLQSLSFASLSPSLFENLELQLLTINRTTNGN